MAEGEEEEGAAAATLQVQCRLRDVRGGKDRPHAESVLFGHSKNLQARRAHLPSLRGKLRRLGTRYSRDNLTLNSKWFPFSLKGLAHCANVRFLRSVFPLTGIFSYVFHETRGSSDNHGRKNQTIGDVRIRQHRRQKNQTSGNGAVPLE